MKNRNTVKQKTVCCDLLHFITFFDFFQAFLFYFDGTACMNEKTKRGYLFLKRIGKAAAYSKICDCFVKVYNSENKTVCRKRCNGNFDDKFSRMPKKRLKFTGFLRIVRF